jgi:hypothetical protein
MLMRERFGPPPFLRMYTIGFSRNAIRVQELVTGMPNDVATGMFRIA